MHRAMASRQIARRLVSAEPLASSIGVPLFLCPALARFPASTLRRPQPSRNSTHSTTGQHFLCQRRANHTEALVVNHESNAAELSTVLEHESLTSETAAAQLPLSCSGCGAFSQTTDPNQLGYYDLKAKRIRQWIKPETGSKAKSEVAAKEDEVIDSVLANMNEATLKELGLDPESLRAPSETAESGKPPTETTSQAPLCARCHLLTHEIGNPEKVDMFHPTVESLRETIEESPHKHNHIYHIIDAADFPMSLVPRLNVLLGDIPMRTRNRRSRSEKYMKDRKFDISFVISRGDLLGPTKPVVDKMMPYLREVLRDALGRVGGRVRLGNLHCVSAKRDWWTKELKKDIWKRGGAGWFVGKVNVGKSQLFNTVYPKGMVTKGSKTDGATEPGSESQGVGESTLEGGEGKAVEDDIDFGDLLPPPRPLEMYPQMPIISPHPGTTASPIRIPFGNHKGELIDLPGLSRSDLENHVKPEHRKSLIMQKRIVPSQVSMQEGRSLILGGGLIRITPTTPRLTFLMYNFTPLSEHMTATDKAVEFQAQTRINREVENISTEEAAGKMRSAGLFKLRYDVTKARAGPMVMKHRGGVPVDKLPFRVVSLDILIEGVGYVEVVAQVRTRDFQEMVASELANDLNEGDDEHTPWTPKAKPTAWTPKSEPAKPKNDDPFHALTVNRIDDSKSRMPVQEQPTKPKAVRSRPTVEWPTVEVFTPEGKFVDFRQPINGWLLNKPLVKDVHKRKRPRKSMRGQKKKEKAMKRASTSSPADAAGE